MTLFVAKSTPKRTRVPRHVTGRLAVRRLVNVNPGRPRTSSTTAPGKPQHHRLRSQRSESKSFFFFKRTHGIVKRAIQEAGEGGDAAAPARRARGGAAAPPAEVKPPPPEEVKPPPPKEVKPPRRKVALQLLAVVRAPTLNADEATWLANLFHEAFMKLRMVAVHLGVPTPSHPL
jgi:hypothetical protein